MRRKLAAGNWKMNGSLAALDMVSELSATHSDAGCDILICPPAPYLQAAVARAQNGPVRIGAQDCHGATSGAHTGDVSATMIAELGARYAILGHSERREAYRESDAEVQTKAKAAQSAGLCAIVCIGESLAQREAGTALPIIRDQLKGSIPPDSRGETLVVAYEPIWAIGTGKIPTMDEIAEVHATLREDLQTHLGAEGIAVRLLYGGSVKPGNAKDIFALPEVDGALVGGASLKSADFSPIIDALQSA